MAKLFHCPRARAQNFSPQDSQDGARIKGRQFVLAYFRRRGTKKSAPSGVSPEWIGVNDSGSIAAILNPREPFGALRVKPERHSTAWNFSNVETCYLSSRRVIYVTSLDGNRVTLRPIFNIKVSGRKRAGFKVHVAREFFFGRARWKKFDSVA